MLGEVEWIQSCNKLYSIHLKDFHLLKDADHHIVHPDGKRKYETFTECNTYDNYTTFKPKAIEAWSMYKAEKDQEGAKQSGYFSWYAKGYNIAASLLYFTNGWFLFNEIFVPVGGKAKGKSIQPTGVLWHEAIKGRSAKNVAKNEEVTPK